MTYPITPNDDRKMLRITDAMRHITAREGALHRLKFAMHSPVISDRCAMRTTVLLSDLSLSHPSDRETLFAIDKALTKLERRPHLLFGRDKKSAVEHRVYTGLLLLKQASVHNFHDAPLGHIIEKHLTRALIAHARNGHAPEVLDMLINPDPQPDTKPDISQPDRHIAYDYARLKPATQRMILAILDSVTDVNTRLKLRYYLQSDVNLTLRINHPELEPKITQWLDAPIMPQTRTNSLIQKLKNWVPR